MWYIESLEELLSVDLLVSALQLGFRILERHPMVVRARVFPSGPERDGRVRVS